MAQSEDTVAKGYGKMPEGYDFNTRSNAFLLKTRKKLGFL